MKHVPTVLLVLFLLALLAGCFGPVKVTVYGATGKQFVAPDLCGAIVACKQSGEAACYYNATTLITANGDKEAESCKAAK